MLTNEEYNVVWLLVMSAISIYFKIMFYWDIGSAHFHVHFNRFNIQLIIIFALKSRINVGFGIKFLFESEFTIFVRKLV